MVRTEPFELGRSNTAEVEQVPGQDHRPFLEQLVERDGLAEGRRQGEAGRRLANGKRGRAGRERSSHAPIMWLETSQESSSEPEACAGAGSVHSCPRIRQTLAGCILGSGRRSRVAVTAITGGRLLPVEGEPIEGGTLLLRDGKIAAIGADGAVRVPRGAERVDARGKVVTPGLIDAHTHVGVQEEAEGWAGQDTNELTDPVTAHVRALDAVNPADLGFRDAVSGGVLAANVNPGSGNPIGGQTVALKTWGRTVDQMVLRQPSGLKSALGENPKRVYGEKKETPSTRLGTAGVIRDAFVRAANYLAKQEHAARKKNGAAGEDDDKPFERDLKLEALGRVLRREIPWRQHCHRADDIATALRLAEEFGYRLVIDHGTEAHLLADVLAARDIPVIIGPLFTSRSKVELRNRSLRNPARLAAAGVTIALTTDHPVVPIHFLVYQAALSVKDGLDAATALRSITIHPAHIMGVDDRLGSLAVGKDADVCLWSGDPLDVMSRVEQAYVNGERIYTWDAERREGLFAPGGAEGGVWR